MKYRFQLDIEFAETLSQQDLEMLNLELAQYLFSLQLPIGAPNEPERLVSAIDLDLRRVEDKAMSLKPAGLGL